MKRYLALFTGAADGSSPPDPTPEAIAKGMAAWQKWMVDHAASVKDTGGPLGKTKKASKAGISDIKNAVAGYVIVEAESHDAAATLFLNHPHFAIFPGEGVEIMEVLPIPGQG